MFEKNCILSEPTMKKKLCGSSHTFINAENNLETKTCATACASFSMNIRGFFGDKSNLADNAEKIIKKKMKFLSKLFLNLVLVFD